MRPPACRRRCAQLHGVNGMETETAHVVMVQDGDDEYPEVYPLMVHYDRASAEAQAEEEGGWVIETPVGSRHQAHQQSRRRTRGRPVPV